MNNINKPGVTSAQDLELGEWLQGLEATEEVQAPAKEARAQAKEAWVPEEDLPQEDHQEQLALRHQPALHRRR